MRAFLTSIYTLVFLTMVYAAPTHNNAGNCKAVGSCVEESVPREMAVRGNKNLLHPNNNPQLGAAHIVTEIAYATATVTEVVVATVHPSSASSHSNRRGLLDGLLSGPHPPSPKPTPHGNSLANGLPASDPVKILPAVEQLLSPTENQVKVDFS